MVGRNNDAGNVKPDEKQIEKPGPSPAVARKSAPVRPPMSAAESMPIKMPAMGKQPAEIKKDFPTGVQPVQKKDERPKPVTPGKPMVIEPEREAKPIMPELKGEAGKKGVRERKPVGKPLSRPKNRSLTFLLFVCLILLAGGAALLVLLMLDIALPEWTEPVLNFYRKIPLFPE